MLGISSENNQPLYRRGCQALLVALTFSAIAAISFFAFPSAAIAQEGGAPQPIPATETPPGKSPTINDALSPKPGEADGDEEDAGTGIPTTPIEIIEKLNFWLVPFLLASIIAVWFTIERVVVLRRTRVIPPEFVDPFMNAIQHGISPEVALEKCESNDSPTAAIFGHGVRKWGRSSVEVEQAMIDGGERQVGQLRRHLRVLNGVATVTPLLGLLGTVIGMIQAFNDIASAGAMGKADQLAAGIAVALLTTAFGLAIAIPSLIMYMYLSGRVEALVMEMDELALRVVRAISADGLPTQRPTPQPSLPRVQEQTPVS
jgi:biopolymer transport protein ExbB